MPVQVSACLIIDTSASMSPWVANTVIDSKAFVSYALPGDAIAVLNYDTNARNCYAPNGAMAIVDGTMSQVAAATAAIGTLTFNGSSTAIGEGMLAGNNMLRPSGVSPKASVLLTDGQQNAGIQPSSVPPDFRIYPCGMGTAVSTTQLQGIASRTNGLYYPVAYPIDMMRIYNQIRSDQPRIQGVVNYMGTMSTSTQSLFIPAAVSSTSELQQVGVVWDNPSYVYSSNSSPSGNQLYIVLYQPDGTLAAAVPRTGSGYAIFNLVNPQVGTWNVYVQYAGSTNALHVTTGVFEFTPASASEIRLAVDTPITLKAGSPLKVAARLLHEDDAPVAIQTVTAELARPVLSVKNALVKYREEISAMCPEAAEAGDGEDTPLRRLDLLHRLHLPVHNILPRQTMMAPMVAADDGSHQLVVPNTQQGGAYTVVVRATGYSEKSKTMVQRTRLVPVLVDDT
jgi:hypothetical protein